MKFSDDYLANLIDLYVLYSNDRDGYEKYLADLNAHICVNMYKRKTILSESHPMYAKRTKSDYWYVDCYDDLFEAIEDATKRVNNKLWEDDRAYLFSLCDLMDCWSEDSSFEEYYLKELCDFTDESLAALYDKYLKDFDGDEDKALEQYDIDIMNKVTAHAEASKDRFFVTPNYSYIKWHGQLNDDFNLNVYDDTYDEKADSKVSSNAVARRSVK